MNQVAFAKFHSAEKISCNEDVHPLCCRSSHITYAQMNADILSVKVMNICSVPCLLMYYLLEVSWRRRKERGKVKF